MGIDSQVQEIVEKNWDNNDDYLTEDQRFFLQMNGAMNRFQIAYLDDMVERYRGTCSFLLGKDEEFLEYFDMYREFDEQIFSCETCGWWYDDGEQGESGGEELICDECAKEEEK